MTKITLQDLTSLTNEQSALNLINGNNTVIETQSDTFLSRDGTSPNQMLADLDMNSKRILNLPAPVNDTEPLRKKDVPDNQQIGDISGAVEDAQQAAAIAAAAAVSASNSATNAATNADKLKGTSTTSNVISLGSKTFTTQSGKFFDEGIWLLITSDANEANYMHGVSTAYTGTTLTFNVTNVGGAGNFADWTIRLSGTQGAKGDQGLVGPPGATGGSFFPVARAIATTPVNIAGGLEAGDIVDGVTLANGDVVLLTAQTTSAQNGLYTAVASGTAQRTANYTTFSSMAGCYVAVMEGNTYSDTLWACISNIGGTIDVDPLLFQQYTTGKNYTVSEKNTITSNIGFTNGTAVTAQANTNLDLATGWTVDITGTTNITQITLAEGRTRTVRFTSPLILSNNANLILPGGTNINVLAGDVATFQGYLGGVVRCLNYERADGTTLKIGGSLDTVDSNAATKGVMLYRDTSAWASLLPPTPGSNQRVLTSTGTGTNPAWGQVNLAQAVTGNLPTANLNSGTNATSATFWRGDGQWSTPAGSGDVSGPAGNAADSTVAIFNGTTGKILKDAGATLSTGTLGRLGLAFSLRDQSTNEMLNVNSVGPTAVNEVSIGNGAAGARPSVVATGNDTNIELLLGGKGTGGAVVQGTTTNNDPPAGYVGQNLTPAVENAITLVSDVAQSCCNLTLTPGDWQVDGAVVFAMGGASQYMLASIHTSNNVCNSDAFGYRFYSGFYHSIGFPVFIGNQSPTVHLVGGRITVANGATLVIHLTAQSGFAGSMQAIGRLAARRMR